MFKLKTFVATRDFFNNPEKDLESQITEWLNANPGYIEVERSAPSVTSFEFSNYRSVTIAVTCKFEKLK